MKQNIIEILGGNGIENAFKELKIEAHRTYKRDMLPEDDSYHGEVYEVWEMSQKDYGHKLRDISDSDWNDEWGWWRWSNGSNLVGEPITTFKINKIEIVAWYSENKLSDYIECYLEDAYIEDFDSEEDAKEQLVQDYFKEECKYKDFFEYCCEQWGASTEKNVCAIAVELARLNNITMGELLNKIG